MAETAKQIVKTDVSKIIDILNKAYAEEWLAFHQYWLGARLAVGPQRTSIVHEFNEHAEQEMEHAEKLAQRIIELDGVPVLSPDNWTSKAECEYLAPTRPDVISLLSQNLASEQCAIRRYQEICDMCCGVDYITSGIAAQILAEEVEHEQEVADFIADISLTR